MSAMGLKIYAGRTFHVRKTSTSKPHLWIAITEPDGTPEKVVIVNLTTRYPSSDTTVILNIGDHRFIKHETIVFYADALFAKVTAIQDAIKNGISKFDDDCSDALLERIQLGLLESPSTAKNIREYCREYFKDF